MFTVNDFRPYYVLLLYSNLTLLSYLMAVKLLSFVYRIFNKVKRRKR